MADPRIVQRNNPLTRELNRIAALNEELGTRRSGGGLPTPEPGVPSTPAPVPGPPSVVQGGSGTVLPPAPRPLTEAEALEDGPNAAELEELERLWAADPSNPANIPGRIVTPGEAPPTQHVPVIMKRPVAGGIVFDSVLYIDVMHGKLIMDTGAEIPLSPEAAHEIRVFAYNATILGLQEQMKKSMRALRVSMGLEEKSEPAPKEVPPMRHGSGPIAVPEVEESVPQVRVEGPTDQGEARPGGDSPLPGAL